VKQSTLRIALTVVLIFTATQVGAAGNVSAGQEKSAPCAACHGADGNSENPGFPRIAGQYQSYLVKALRDYKSGSRQNPIMAGMVAALSDQDMQDLAAYFAAQSGDLYQVVAD
jgi:cytochrome c553